MGILDEPAGERQPRFGHFEVVKRSECWRLLAGKSVGRVGYVAPDGPQILPVNYAVRDTSIVFLRRIDSPPQLLDSSG